MFVKSFPECVFMSIDLHNCELKPVDQKNLEVP